MTGKQEQIIQTRSMLLSWLLRWVTYCVVGVGYLLGLFLVQRTLVSFLLLTGICGAWLLIYHTRRRSSQLYRMFALFCLACASLLIPFPSTNVYWHPILPITAACVMMTVRPRLLGLLAAGVLWLCTSLAISLLIRQWDTGVQIMLLISFSSVCVCTATINALAVAHLRLQEYSTQVEELSVMRERNRIAREIHDTLGHALTLLAVQLETTTQLEVRGDPRLHENLLEARRVAKACLTDVRHSVEALRPGAISAGSLQEQLRRLVAEFETTCPETRITLDLEEMTHSLSPELCQALYRCAQEALTNIRKHAHATKVLLRLSTSAGPEGKVELTVLDNGQGPTPRQERSAPGFGLLGMRERAALLKGTLQAGPEPELGWRVEVVLPLTQCSKREAVH
ncbi:sensor histidine kinase [Ktedonosporobacter rubrisoli]|uniref:histidine kinase n=1 Tax=Ktedonosporobacter rubrisoli TaxID=2509675 RepID=A0A4P6K2S7_KTERU|nr:sensor histidine kinase [Ktedonosporobacter rubrisoli]QBD82222.1 sensor histidine kinase [Ktedonosporobacter rubrisoli]